MRKRKEREGGEAREPAALLHVTRSPMGGKIGVSGVRASQIFHLHNWGPGLPTQAAMTDVIPSADQC